MLTACFITSDHAPQSSIFSYVHIHTNQQLKNIEQIQKYMPALKLCHLFFNEVRKSWAQDCPGSNVGMLTFSIQLFADIDSVFLPLEIEIKPFLVCPLPQLDLRLRRIHLPRTTNTSLSAENNELQSECDIRIFKYIRHTLAPIKLQRKDNSSTILLQFSVFNCFS